jgi:hypothetical protein
MQSVINSLGQLRQDTNPKNWQGKISPASRLNTKEITKSQIDKVLASLDKFYVSTTKGSAVRCIDGRTKLGVGGKKIVGEKLGAQIPGGTIHSALVWRLAKGADKDLKGSSLSSDFRSFAVIEKQLSFSAGGHRDDHAGEGRTGCGALDALLINLTLTQTDAVKDIETMTALLLGENYSRDSFNEVIDAIQNILAEQNSYSVDKDNALEDLQAINQSGVETLTGQHGEVAVVVNLIEGTTLRRDDFNATTDSQIQVFNFDFWRSIEVSKSFESQPGMCSRYLHGEVILAVAALMHLTDGSPRLLVRA